MCLNIHVCCRPEPAAGSGGGESYPAPVEEVDDRVPCPYCDRKYSAIVAERHIPKVRSPHLRC